MLPTYCGHHGLVDAVLEEVSGVGSSVSPGATVVGRGPRLGLSAVSALDLQSRHGGRSRICSSVATTGGDPSRSPSSARYQCSQSRKCRILIGRPFGRPVSKSTGTLTNSTADQSEPGTAAGGEQVGQPRAAHELGDRSSPVSEVNSFEPEDLVRVIFTTRVSPSEPVTVRLPPRTKHPCPRERSTLTACGQWSQFLMWLPRPFGWKPVRTASSFMKSTALGDDANCQNAEP
jgi:hypothetical protein